MEKDVFSVDRLKTAGGEMGAQGFSRIVLYSALAVSLAGCGGGGGTVATPENVQTGRLLDGPVCGVQYATPSWSGVTEFDGTFNYQEGEPVTFFIGDVVLGTARANRFVTPIDMVPGATNTADTTVINICRFLQSLDNDGDLGNGIVLPQGLEKELRGFSINFSDPAFDQNSEVLNMFDKLNSIPICDRKLFLVTDEYAKIHFEDTLIEIEGIRAEEEGRELTAAIVKPVGNAILIQGQSIPFEGWKIRGTAPYAYAWDIGDKTGFSSEEDPGLVSFYTTGNFPVVFTVTDADDVTASDHRLVTVVTGAEYPVPGKDEPVRVHFCDTDPNITVSPDAEVRLKAEITMGNPPFYYFWHYPDTAICSFSEDPLDASFRFPSAGRYTVSIMVIDSWNQDDWTSTVQIIVK